MAIADGNGPHFQISARAAFLLTASALSTVALGMQAMPAAAQSSEGRATRLERLEVRGQTDEAEDNDTVAPKEASSATKTDTPLAETPRSVSVVTRKEMEERGVQDIIQAVRYSAGVTTGSFGFDPRFDQIYIRGFNLTTLGDYRDGFRQPYMNYGTFRTEPYSLERMEILKGPASTLYGGGTPGGLVNKISKRPTGEDHREIELQYGTVDRYQAAFDFGGALDEDRTLLYRIVGVARDADTNFDMHDDRLMLMPSLTWQPDDATSLTVYALGQKDKTSASAAALNRDGVALDMRASDPEYDYQKVEQYQVGYELEHTFDNDVTFNQHIRYSYLDLDARYLSGAWDAVDPNIYHRGAHAITDRMNVFQADNRLLRTFELGGLTHNVLAGLDFTDVGSEFSYRTDGLNPDYDLDIRDPVSGISGPTPRTLVLHSAADMRQIGLYAQDQIEAGRWRFTLGGRHDWVKQKNRNHMTGAVTADETNSAFSGQVGALYRLDNGLSPYASFATSFLPVTEKGANGTVLDPQTARQFEVGVKYQPEGSPFSVVAAFYHITETDRPEFVGIENGLFIYAPVGEVTTKGVEIEARASLAAGFDVVAAYTYNDAEITGAADTSLIGNRPAVTPEHVASLWGYYTFDENTPLAGLSLGAGVRYLSETFTSGANTSKNEAVTYLDASVTYDFGKARPEWDGLSLSVSATNLTDERPAVCNEGYCYLGQGRSVVGSLKYRW